MEYGLIHQNPSPKYLALLNPFINLNPFSSLQQLMRLHVLFFNTLALLCLVRFQPPRWNQTWLREGLHPLIRVLESTDYHCWCNCDVISTSYTVLSDERLNYSSDIRQGVCAMSNMAAAQHAQHEPVVHVWSHGLNKSNKWNSGLSRWPPLTKRMSLDLQHGQWVPVRRITLDLTVDSHNPIAPFHGV